MVGMFPMFYLLLYFLPTPLIYITQLNTLVNIKDYHMSITINIPVNRMARLPSRNIGKYAGWGSITSCGYGEDQLTGILSVSLV
jgi:hypothetical protein